MEKLFYYTGVTVWAVITLVVVYVVLKACAYISRYIWMTLKNVRFWLFGYKKLKGRNYQIWLRHHANRHGLQRHNHKWSYLRRLAYRRFLINAWKERNCTNQ